MRLTMALLVFLAAACGDDDPGGGDDDDDTSDGGGGGGDGGGGGGDGGGGGGDGAQLSCTKIDLVIAVDNSSSMSEERAALRDTVFPAFANELLDVGNGLEDFRVGVLDACPNPATFHTAGTPGACNFQSGQVWMDSDSTNLVGEFQCVGQIDDSDRACSGENDDEQPISSAAASLEPPWSTMQNAGFSRPDDALLVIIAITDEDEQPTPNKTAQEVYDRLVATRGDVRKMVFLGIGGATDCMGVYGSAEQADKLVEVTNLFKAQNRGVFWDLCGGALEMGLDQALTVISQACDEFPGIP